ncbi:MAG: cation:proton antiporter [Alphaproteobacteria bacterium]|nr:cation:proton antiporter [Alphaproteobacteria bacterium]
MTTVEALQPAIIYLGAGLAAAFASQAVRLSPIVGYLVAGLVIGPSGFSLVEDNETTNFLAELGVVFLLFDIGLHFSLREIRTRRDDMLGLAPLQIALCGLAFATLGLALGFDPAIALVVGVSLSLSSTAIVARILQDRNQPGCPMGRSATAVLVAQDIVAIFILVFAASLGDTTEVMGVEMAIALGLAILSLIIALGAGRYLIRPLFKSLAATNNREALTVVALFVVLAASAATARAGLSLTLGAFLAGMAISDTPYRHVVQSEVKPFQGLLLGLFFMSVGMDVNLPAMAAIWPAVLLAALVIVIVKTGLIFAAARLTRWATPGATQLGFLLSQGSEFTLVAVGIPAVAAAMPGAWPSIIVAAVAVTLVAAPIWTALGLHIARLLAERTKADPVDVEEAEDNPVLVFGMTEEGRLAADALRDHHIPYIAIESDPERFVSASSEGYHVIYGDARDSRLMENVGAARARAIVLGAPRFAAPKSVTEGYAGPVPKRFVAVDSAADRDYNAGLGLRAHLALGEPRGVELAADLLREMGVPHHEIAAWIEDLSERRGFLASADEADRAEVA